MPLERNLALFHRNKFYAANDFGSKRGLPVNGAIFWSVQIQCKTEKPKNILRTKESTWKFRKHCLMSSVALSHLLYSFVQNTVATTTLAVPPFFSWFVHDTTPLAIPQHTSYSFYKRLRWLLFSDALKQLVPINRTKGNMKKIVQTRNYKTRGYPFRQWKLQSVVLSQSRLLPDGPIGVDPARGLCSTHPTLLVSPRSPCTLDVSFTGVLPCKRVLAVRALPPRCTTRHIGITHLVASEDFGKFLLLSVCLAVHIRHKFFCWLQNLLKA